MGARSFYFITYFFYYYCAFKYPSELSKGLKDGSYISFSITIVTHLVAIHLFLTTGDDPGWADEHMNDKVPDDE